MPTKNKCFVCNKRTEIKVSFRLCSICFASVFPSTQKKIVDSFLAGQDTGQVQASKEFIDAINEAVKDVYYIKFGSRTPNKTVIDNAGQSINAPDLVEWNEEGPDGTFRQWGKVIATYWESQELTVRYFQDNYPKSKRMPGKECWLKQKRLQE